jgi:hypothetical protein
MRDDVGSRGVRVGNVTHGLCVSANHEAGGRHEGGRGGDGMQGRGLCKFLKEEGGGGGGAAHNACTTQDAVHLYVHG